MTRDLGGTPIPDRDHRWAEVYATSELLDELAGPGVRRYAIEVDLNGRRRTVAVYVDETRPHHGHTAALNRACRQLDRLLNS